MRGVGIIILALSLLAAGVVAAVAQCPVNAEPTFLRLAVDEGNSRATLHAHLYALNMSCPTRDAIAIPQGLLIVSWADYLPNTPATSSGACKMVTDGNGDASADFGPNPPNSNYPPGGSSLTYTVPFCPFTANAIRLTDPQPEWMANCARLKSASDQSAVRPLNYKTLPDCPNSGSNSVYSKTDALGAEHDLSDFWQPSTTFLTQRNNAPAPGSVMFCWGLAAVFGLLFSAMFVSGRNPLYFLDFSATRNVRMNRSAGYYMPMTQNVSIAPASVYSAIDRGANMVASSSSEKSESEGDVKEAKSNSDSAAADLKSAKADNASVQSSPSATPQQKEAAQAKVDAAQKKFDGAQKTLGAAQAKLDAANDLATARASGNKSQIQAAQAKYATATKDFNKLSGNMPRTTHTGFDARMQAASQQGISGSWLNRQAGIGLNKINPLTDESGNAKTILGSSFLGQAASSAWTGMVKGVVLAVPGAALGRGGFTWSKAGTSAGSSLKSQARADVKEEMIQGASALAGEYLAPLFTHGFGQSSPEAQAAKKDVDTAQEELNKKQADLVKLQMSGASSTDPQVMAAEAAYSEAYQNLASAQQRYDSFAGPDEINAAKAIAAEKAAQIYPSADPAAYAQARQEYAAAQQNVGILSAAYETAISESKGTFSGSDMSQGIVRNLLSPGFEMAVGNFISSPQPPRLSAMQGWGESLGLSLNDYLSSSVRSAQAYDPNALQKQLQEFNAAMTKRN
ncbi:Uncharacterised protein [uncultured archaeon]|nr:Uncharacterised protein [uncultured archaeon]